MLKIAKLFLAFLFLTTTTSTFSQPQSINEKQAIELVTILSNQTIDHISCQEGAVNNIDVPTLFRRFFTEELVQLILWEKYCQAYKYKQGEYPARQASLVGKDIFFGESQSRRNDDMTFSRLREIKLSSATRKDAVIVTAKYTLDYIPSWTKFTVVSTAQGPRIDDIQLKGAGNDYVMYGIKFKSLKALIKKEYECRQKRLKEDCDFLDEEYSPSR
jgi:hypothetical protein